MDKIIDNNNNFYSELNFFFSKIDNSNYYKNECYQELIGLIRKYTTILDDKSLVIDLYVKFYEVAELNDWQADIYGDVCERLTGFSSFQNRIEL